MFLRFLLQRPIAILMTFVALLIFSVLAYWQLPVSLLPAIEVPEIIIKVSYPNRAAQEIEETVLREMRATLLTIKHLEDIESEANAQTGLLRLNFAYEANMKLSYLEVNEKIDQLLNNLPKDLPRPQVIRVNTSDIPIIRLQVLPKNQRNDLVQASELAEKILKKRLAQIKGISLIDMNGQKEQIVQIVPNLAKMQAWQINMTQIVEVIKQNNLSLGSISLKDGNYRYDVKILTALKNIEDIRQLQIANSDSSLVALREIAQVQENIAEKQGLHVFNTSEGLVLNLHKQANAKMGELMPQIYDLIEHFKADYPQYHFVLSQDQSLLLRMALTNLQSSLFWGGVFAFLVLFLFMRNYRIPLIIGISLPSSLFLSFLVFYVFQISFNIISLSGLALGLGMLIDNAIIVIDNISQKQETSSSLLEACVAGTLEMIAPLLSSVLTTLAVFVPLIFVSGLVGALFYEQAVAVASILLSALLVSFVLIPLVYLMLKPQVNASKKALKKYTLLGTYKQLYKLFFRYQTLSLVLILSLLPLAYFLFLIIQKENLPKITKTETALHITWNENISLLENQFRTQKIIRLAQSQLAEAEVGTTDFLLSQVKPTMQETEIYLKFATETQRQIQSQKLKNFLSQAYPLAKFELQTASNTFEQLFESKEALLNLKFRHENTQRTILPQTLDTLFGQVSEQYPIFWQRGQGSQETQEVVLIIKQKELLEYGLEYRQVVEKLKSLFGNYQIDYLRSFGEEQAIIINPKQENMTTLLESAQVANATGTYYPLKAFVNYKIVKNYQTITADKLGIYHSLWSDTLPDINKLTKDIRKTAFTQNTQADIVGNYLEQEKNLQELSYIFLISLLLLYFILSAQFESFWQPLLVILSLGLGLAGSLFLLLITGQSLNIMASIGIIISLGIMVNDTILKIDSINRLRKTLPLLQALAKAGELRLQAILMTSITTILALLPILLASGIGADLQKPLVIAVIGALTIGTFTALYFIPLAYRLIVKK